MSNLPRAKEINKALQPSPWSLGNQVLYDLCQDNFKHDSNEKTLAKVWLIGRSYSAVPERPNTGRPACSNTCSLASF